MKVCGIDEAGKGPVLGDMVIVGYELDEEKLKELDANDSKQLSPKERERLYSKLIEMADNYKVVRVSATEIDERNRVGCNLNKLEAIKMAAIIDELKPDKAIIDCPHPIPKKFEMEIRRYLNWQDVEIVAEHKADANHKIVGAASIIAKVIRDRHVREIGDRLGIDLGSGYPHDPKTIDAIERFLNGESKEIGEYIRHSWETFKNKKIENEQRSIFDYNDSN